MVSDGAGERDEPGKGSMGGVKRGGGVAIRLYNIYLKTKQKNITVKKGIKS